MRDVADGVAVKDPVAGPVGRPGERHRARPAAGARSPRSRRAGRGVDAYRRPVARARPPGSRSRAGASGASRPVRLIQRQWSESPCVTSRRSVCGHERPLIASVARPSPLGLVGSMVNHHEIRKMRSAGTGRSRRVHDDRAVELAVVGAAAEHRGRGRRCRRSSTCRGRSRVKRTSRTSPGATPDAVGRDAALVAEPEDGERLRERVAHRGADRRPGRDPDQRPGVHGAAFLPPRTRRRAGQIRPGPSGYQVPFRASRRT